MVFYGHIQNGELEIRSKSKFEDDIAELPDGRVQIIVHPVSDSVSTRLRKYYWALCRLIANYYEDIGYPDKKAEDVHEENKKLYMTRSHMNFETAEVYQQEQSHMDLTNSQMLDICKRLQMRWAERGLYLPDPNEDLEEKIMWSDDKKGIGGSSGSETEDGT